MTLETDYKNSEPVPAASQLAVLPFLAAMNGFLRNAAGDKSLRVTIHRVMMRGNNGFLQQMCMYLGSSQTDWRKPIGRIFPVTTGIIGAAFETSTIFRTKYYPDEKALKEDLTKDMAETGDNRGIERVALSYLAIPFLGPKREVVIILYADSGKVNLFADDERLRHIQSMCEGLCSLFDWLQDEPFPNLRNFPLQPGEPTKSNRTVYARLQEPIEWLSAPRFQKVGSFNYEASVS